MLNYKIVIIPKKPASIWKRKKLEFVWWLQVRRSYLTLSQSTPYLRVRMNATSGICSWHIDGATKIFPKLLKYKWNHAMYSICSKSTWDFYMELLNLQIPSQELQGSGGAPGFAQRRCQWWNKPIENHQFLRTKTLQKAGYSWLIHG